MCNINLAGLIRRAYIKYLLCNRQISRNRSTKCNRCRNQSIGQQVNNQNNNDRDNTVNINKE